MNQSTLWFLVAQEIVASGVGAFGLLLGMAKRKPSLVSIGALALVELLLLVQLVVSIVLVAGGARAKTDTVEFFSYLVVALIVPVGAGFWALVERTRWSTMVIGVAGFTVAIMQARMEQIWFG
ncbi:MAG: hypothetical protein RLZZ471_1061 [Actinomycetota bacterium]|jgi:hypothetical protein